MSRLQHVSSFHLLHIVYSAQIQVVLWNVGLLDTIYIHTHTHQLTSSAFGLI